MPGQIAVERSSPESRYRNDHRLGTILTPQNDVFRWNGPGRLMRLESFDGQTLSNAIER
jgi:hypothetical protein